MKCALVFAAILAVCLAQQGAHPPQDGHGHHDHNMHQDQLDAFVHHEVHTLYTNNNQLTVDECTMKCDNIFDLVDPKDEQAFDDKCKHWCACEINHSCGNTNHP